MRRFWDGLERRRARRYDAQLPARLNGIMVYSSGTEDSAGGNLLRISCLTRDISLTGLSLVVPVEKLDARYLPRESCLMLVMLELPEGAVALEAAPMHYKIVEEEERHLYQLGAGITKISEADRTRYLEYLDSLG